MPAVSESQRRLFAIAEHHPEQLHTKNSGLAKLPHKTLHDFASTKHLADGRKPMTNTTFQQSERTSGKRPEWMERAKAHAQNKPMATLADGKRPQLSDAFSKSGQSGHSLHDTLGISRDKKIPQYRVRAAAKSGNPKERHQAQAALNMENARR